MKFISMYAAVLLLAACNSPKGDSATTTDKQAAAETTGSTYVIDTTSTIGWAASKPTATHNGTFKLQDGTLTVNENNLTAGKFTINVASIQNKDLGEADGKAKLEGHLKSPDFFDVAKYPTATFEITNVKPYTADSAAATKDATHVISGNLTLKGNTKNVSFPAKITMDERSLTAKADFNIDRTLWGMNYKGPGNPQDWFISKEVNLKLDLAATKK